MSEKLTHWKKLNNPDYLGSWAFGEGEERTLTIREVTRESVTGADGKAEDCTVVHWQEQDKPLILNVTNSKMITKLAETPYIEKWPGLRVTLQVKSVSAFGDTVDAVRVSKKRPAPIQDTACAECGQVITASGGYTAAQIIKAGMSKFGKPMCMDCVNKGKQKEITNENNADQDQEPTGN